MPFFTRESTNLFFSLHIKRLNFFILICLVAGIAACASSDSEQKDEASEEDTVSVSLTILDEQGRAIDGMTASSTDFVIDTQQTTALKQFILELESNPGSGMIQLSRSGYHHALLYLEQGKYDSSKTVSLLKKGNPITVNAESGGNFSAGDGAAVNIPVSAFEHADGSPVTGDMELFITTVNTDDENEAAAFPGSYLGAPESSDQDVPLFTFGVVSMSFFQNGEKLQLADGQSAALTLPIYVSKHLDDSDIVAGQQIPFWILNESSGVWEQHGEGTVVNEPLSPTGLALSVNTPHFSWFNTDAWGRPGSISPGSLGFATGVGTGWCRFSAEILGVEVGEPLETRIIRGARGYPSSTVVKTEEYDGEPINSFIPQGSGYIIRARKPDDPGISDQTGFTCSDTGAEIRLTLDLDPTGEPLFLNWKVTVIPRFTFNDNSQLWEVSENSVIFGGDFTRDEDNEVFVTSPFMVTPVVLGPNVIFDETLTVNDTSPIVLTATLENQEGTTTEETTIEFIDSQSPNVDTDLFAVNREDGTTEFYWNVLGADTIEIEKVGMSTDPTEAGIPYSDSDPLNFPVPELNGYIANDLSEYEGYLRIVFENQYGATEAYLFLDPNIVCLIGSELCAI